MLHTCNAAARRASRVDFGLASQQYQTLVAIGGAQEMLIKPNAMVQPVGRLSAMGLVERERPDTNRRSVNVALPE